MNYRQVSKADRRAGPLHTEEGAPEPGMGEDLLGEDRFRPSHTGAPLPGGRPPGTGPQR